MSKPKQISEKNRSPISNVLIIYRPETNSPNGTGYCVSIDVIQALYRNFNNISKDNNFTFRIRR